MAKNFYIVAKKTTGMYLQNNQWLNLTQSLLYFFKYVSGERQHYPETAFQNQEREPGQKVNINE